MAQPAAPLPFPQPRRGGYQKTDSRTISRLAVLKAAAQFGASRPDLKSADVLAIAERWMVWIEQGRR